MVDVDHVGSAHDDASLELLMLAARERLLPGQEALDLDGLEQVPARMADIADWTAGNLPAPTPVGRPRAVAAGGRVVATASLVLWDVLCAAYARLGFDALRDDAFRAMVLARIIEPASKAETVRVLGEVGAPCPSLRTLFRALDRLIAHDYRAGSRPPRWRTRRGPRARLRC